MNKLDVAQRTTVEAAAVLAENWLRLVDIRVNDAPTDVLSYLGVLMSNPSSIEEEFDRLVTAAGLSIPPERRQGVFACYVDLKNMAELVRCTRGATDEPSDMFSLSFVL